MITIIIAAVSTFFALVMLTKIITGEERITYYHHEIAVLGIAGLLLWTLRQPVLPYLDVTTLGTGLFLALGRIGCLMVGCCHGRPHRWGVTYGLGHAQDGFAASLVGARLFPIQVVESLYVSCTVLAGVCILLREHRHGDALVWYLVAYGAGRFYFEFARGDAARSYYWGFSQAQWISVLQTVCVVLAAACGYPPFQPWHVGAAILLPATMAAIAFRRCRRKGVEYRLFHSKHILELAETVDLAVSLATEAGSGPPSERPRVVRTSLGVQVSAMRLGFAGQTIHHYSLSCGPEVDAAAAVPLALLVALLKHPSAPSEIIDGNGGVSHLLVHQSTMMPGFNCPLAKTEGRARTSGDDLHGVPVS
jgi:hypothetical protein